MVALTEQPASAKKALATLEEALEMPPSVVARRRAMPRACHVL